MKLSLEGKHAQAWDESRNVVKLQANLANLPKIDEGIEDEFLEVTFWAIMCAGDVAAAAQKWADSLRYYSVLSNPKLNLKEEKKSPILINIARIHYLKGDLNSANKLWRKALDCLPPEAIPLRVAIMHNIGQSFMQLSKYKHAMQYFGVIVHERSSSPFEAGDTVVLSASLHKMLCHYFLKQYEELKSEFERLLTLNPIGGEKIAKYSET